MRAPTAGHHPAQLLPLIQALAAICLVISSFQFVDLVPPYSDTLLLATLAMAVLVTLLWLLRARLDSSTPRLTCGVLACVLLGVSTIHGQIAFAAPAVVLTVALLVLDASWRASLVGAATIPLIWCMASMLISTQPWWFWLIQVVATTPLIGLGTVLGLLLKRYDAILLAQQEAVRARDEALAHLRRQGTLEKELMLSQERDRAARELHDGLGHRLTLVSMSLELAERTRDRDPQAAWQEVASARATTGQAMREMRAWVRAVSPPRSSQASGIEALEDIAESFRGTGVDIEFVSSVRNAPPLSEAAGLLMHRTVQEGLTNALRHAKAQEMTITVSLDGEPESLWWNVSVLNPPADRRRADGLSSAGPAVLDGLGVVPGFGLSGLTQRAHELGGRIDAGHTPDGFVLRLRLPSNARESAPADDPTDQGVLR